MPATYEVLEGVVQQQGRDDSGFKIVERWCSYDQQYDGLRPKPGDRVKLRVRNGRYIVQVVGEGLPLPPEPAPRRSGGSFPQRSPEEERRIVRQAVLKAAIQWCGVVYSKQVDFREAEEWLTTADVLKVAEKFEQWVYR